MKCSTRNCPNEGEVAMFVATNIVCLVCVPVEMREAASLPEPDPAAVEAQVLAFARAHAEEAGPVLVSPPGGEGPLYVRRRVVLAEPEPPAMVPAPAKAELVEGPLYVRRRVTLNEGEMAAATQAAETQAAAETGLADTEPAPSIATEELSSEDIGLATVLTDEEAASRRVTVPEPEPETGLETSG